MSETNTEGLVISAANAFGGYLGTAAGSAYALRHKDLGLSDLAYIVGGSIGGSILGTWAGARLTGRSFKRAIAFSGTISLAIYLLGFLIEPDESQKLTSAFAVRPTILATQLGLAYVSAPLLLGAPEK